MAINKRDEIVGCVGVGGTRDQTSEGKWIGNRDPTSLAFDYIPQNGLAFVWQNGEIRALESPYRGSAAFALNDSGAIVGTSGGHAVSWSDGTVVDLNTLVLADSGWILQTATGIGERGAIVGWGTRAKARRAFLLVRKDQACHLIAHC